MRPRRLLAAAIVLAVASVGLAAQPASAATPTASMVVAPGDGGVIRTGKGLDVTILVTNTGTAALPAGRIATSLDQAPVASTTALLSAIAHPPEDLQGQLTLTEGSVPALAAGVSTTVRLTLRSTDLSSILTGASGARLLYARYRAGTAQTIAEGSVVRMASGSTAQVGLGTVIPITAPPGTTGVVGVDAQQQLVAPGGAWSDALRAAEAAPEATIALDPEVIVSVRLAGDSATQEATGFLDELAALPNEFIRLPYADADVTLERAAGASTTMEPTSFAGVTVPTAAVPGATPTPVPTASSSSIPTSADGLTAWNWSPQDVSWPVPHTAGAADLSGLGAEGSTVLLPSDDIADSAAQRAAGPFARVKSTKVLVADATTSSLLTEASADGPGGDAALATLTGVLATVAATGETTALLATSGRTSDSSSLGRVLSELARQSWVQQRPLSELATGTATAVSLRGRSVPAARASTATGLVAGERDVQQLGRAITAGGDTVTAPQHLALLAMLSAAWRRDDDGWRSSASSVEQSFSKLVGSVHLAHQSVPKIIGSDGTLRVFVVNALPTPVDVVVRGEVSNGAIQFTGTSSVQIEVPAGGQAEGDLTFRSIRNGTTDLTLRLTTPNGTALGERVARGATVTAGFDTIIAVALLAALGLLLALGVYRNVRRRRRPRAATA